MKVKLIAVLATVMVAASAAFSQYYWDRNDTWWPGMTRLDHTYEWDNGFTAGITIHFTELNSTGQIWSDFHFYFFNPYGNVYINSELGGNSPILNWTPVTVGNATPSPSVSFYAPSAADYVYPGQTFEAIIKLDADTLPDGTGKLYVAWEPSVVPEPSSIAMVGTAAFGLLAMRRRRK